MTRKKSAKEELKQLTVKQRLFVAAYLENGGNATRAARSAGYKGTYGTVQRMGSENLSKPLIKKAIEAKLRARTMGADEVLASLSEIARTSADDFVSFPERMIDPERTIVVRDGETVDKALIRSILEELDPVVNLRKAQRRGKMGMVKKIGYNRYGRLEIELHDRQAALNTLAKYHKLLTDRVEINDWRSAVERAGGDPDEALKIAERSLEQELFADVAKAAKETAET